MNTHSKVYFNMEEPFINVYNLKSMYMILLFSFYYSKIQGVYESMWHYMPANSLWLYLDLFNNAYYGLIKGVFISR